MTTTQVHPLSPDQLAAHDAVIEWYKDGSLPQILTFGGFAGTGKTTTVAQIVATLRALPDPPRFVFGCYTGKAALVLETKLNAADQLQGDYCGTIHGLIYRPWTDPDTKKIKWLRVEELDADIIFVDEASMLDEKLTKDLSSYGIPIVAVGDHGQLPPVSGSHNLMSDPQLRLEKIHRQAANNPIVAMSLRAREGRGILTGDYGAVKKVMRKPLEVLLEDYEDWFFNAGMVLCGTNRTRVKLNVALRELFGHGDGLSQPGEKLICLRNQKDVGLFNGLTGTLIKYKPIEARPNYAEARVELADGRIWEGVLRADQFGRAKTLPHFEREVALFDFGYAMTVHKSQGSEAPTVVVFEECSWMESEDLRRRWLYTAYTRAAERLLIIG